MTATALPCTSQASQYETLMRHVFEHGVSKHDRTGTGTRSVFGYQMRFDLSQGFPLITTKKLHTRSIFLELLWFLRGDSNVRWLQERGVRIWNEWADANGELGPVYGVQWRTWPAPGGGHIDQIAEVVRLIKTEPHSRRLLAFEELFRGTLTHSSVYPREVVLRALHHRASACILAHNHPGASVQPSADDVALTRTLHAALGLVDVRVLDHIIVAPGRHFSLAQQGLMSP